jgi:hypothetical protein
VEHIDTTAPELLQMVMRKAKVSRPPAFCPESSPNCVVIILMTSPGMTSPSIRKNSSVRLWSGKKLASETIASSNGKSAKKKY